MTHRILAACTGNRCRSPMAEALLRFTDAEVASVGLLPAGHEVSGGSVRVMAARGLDIAPIEAGR